MSFKNINQQDYEMLLGRVNSAICQFNNSTDELEQAKQFILNVDKTSTSRNMFFDSVEKRLMKLLDPNSSLVDWFKAKRTALEAIMSKMNSRIAVDPEYLNKMSPENAEGIRCLDKLLGLSFDDLCSMHIADMHKIKKTIVHLRSDNIKAEGAAAAAGNSSSAPVVAMAQRAVPVATPFDESFFFLLLHEIVTKLSIHCSDVANSALRLDGLTSVHVYCVVLCVD